MTVEQHINSYSYLFTVTCHGETESRTVGVRDLEAAIRLDRGVAFATKRLEENHE